MDRIKNKRCRVTGAGEASGMVKQGREPISSVRAQMHEASLESLRPGRPACVTGVLLQKNRQGRWGEGGHAKEQLEPTRSQEVCQAGGEPAGQGQRGGLVGWGLLALSPNNAVLVFLESQVKGVLQGFCVS